MDVAWDKVVNLDDRLPIEDLMREVSEVPWRNIMSSGFSFDDEVAAKIDLLWESGSLGVAAPPAVRRRLGSTAAKVIVEQYALDCAIEYLIEDGWSEIELHGRPFDISCSKAGVELHVEVKGLTSLSPNVTLTYNEVEHAHSWKPTMLIVVRGITIKGKGARTRASGGTINIFEDWAPDRDSLRPRQYDYLLPPN